MLSASVPPCALGVMWSTVFASVARPSRRHCWHRCLSLLSTAARNRSHLVPYPRSCRLLPCWWFSQPALRCSSQYPLRSVVVFAQPRFRHARGMRGGMVSFQLKSPLSEQALLWVIAVLSVYFSLTIHVYPCLIHINNIFSYNCRY